MGDIYVVVEVIMLLPGRKVALVRSECARLFVQFYGGDVTLAEQVIRNRERQEVLQMPKHLVRACPNPGPRSGLLSTKVLALDLC